MQVGLPSTDPLAEPTGPTPGGTARSRSGGSRLPDDRPSPTTRPVAHPRQKSRVARSSPVTPAVRVMESHHGKNSEVYGGLQLVPCRRLAGAIADLLAHRQRALEL